MPEDIAVLVAEHPLLAGLPGDTASLVAGCTKNVAIKAGELLLAEGDVADTLYMLRRGRVSLELRAPGRGPLVIETLGPGSVVGWSWLFPPYRWQMDARATEPVGALSVDASCLRQKAEADPAFGYELMKRFASIILDRLQAARMRLLDLYGELPSLGAPAVGTARASRTGAGHA
jgi:CRP/FNR family cyclic AMP-dependent transcriptional regulator